MHVSALSKTRRYLHANVRTGTCPLNFANFVEIILACEKTFVRKLLLVFSE